jgi:hypothetical protein
VISTGKVWFVNSATGIDASGRGTDPNRPFASINFALTLVGAGMSDVIFAMPGHVETVSAASGLLFGIAGATVVGLGNYANRPTINLGTVATATIAFAAANCSLQNVNINLTNVAGILLGIVVTADGCSIVNCKITQSNVTNQAVVAISIAAGGTNFQLINTEINASGAAGATNAILSSAAVAGLQVNNCNIYGDFSLACISSAGTNHLTNLFITRSRLRNINAAAHVVMALTTSSTGIISYNTFESLANVTNAAGFLSGASSTQLHFFQNFGISDGSTTAPCSAILVPAAGTLV